MECKELDGILWPTNFPEDNYHRLKNLELRHGDVILANFAKCGSHWVSYIIWCIMNPLEDPPTGNKVLEDIPFAEYLGFESWDKIPEGSPRLLFTHILASKMSKSPDAKYIVTVRNPFDCFVSFFHFNKHFIELLKPESDRQVILENFFEDFITGKLPFGGYFDHLKGWYDLRHQPNVLLFSFESLKSDPRNGILNIARFLGLEGPLLEEDGKLLDKLVHQSSFSSMKSNVKYTMKIGSDVENEVPVIRKGQVGGFREVLSPEQEGRLRHKMEEVLAGTELLTEWQNI